MPSCPKCHGTQINETTRQVRMPQADIAQVMEQSQKYVIVGVNIAAAILAIIVITVAPANSDAVRRVFAMGVGVVILAGLLAMYLKSDMRTMHVFTCVACRKSWRQVAQD